MKKIGVALWAVLPLAWASVALAQPNAPDGTGMAPVVEHRHGDPVAFHKEMCTEHYAHKAAHLGYLQAMLGLTDQQQAGWNKYRQTVMDQGSKERAACLEMAPKQNAKPTVLERQAHLEKILSLELQGLQAARPALEALYESLTAEQKAIFDRSAFEHGHHPGPMEGPMGGPMGNGPCSVDGPAAGPQEKPPAQ
ncbi:Spy/CpxP family protein refolding chaperone [Telmatospirillum sp.]|uniref:Spy/CpxP family protein refolding chaperone n=1 Tax=Telmatospirillum sp. TaxID=2079197 RepID=UPI0028520228|nr:Spy/CpxP family protein refolding chaperone [Telmatospirillum sp.]MDR3441068.1 Spy/CpxP family protein refolding chaperone [Telmatospirillum sp.]